jgi:hypothetical protein
MATLLNFTPSLKKAILLNRLTLGIFFFLSGISNYLNFNVKDGFSQTQE